MARLFVLQLQKSFFHFKQALKMDILYIFGDPWRSIFSHAESAKIANPGPQNRVDSTSPFLRNRLGDLSASDWALIEALGF